MALAIAMRGREPNLCGMPRRGLPPGRGLDDPPGGHRRGGSAVFARALLLPPVSVYRAAAIPLS